MTVQSVEVPSIDEASRIIIEAVGALGGIEEVPLREALGRIASADVCASGDQPRFLSAAMDGWAIGTGGEGGYRIVGESRAGIPFQGSLGADEAIYISTGAKIPEGAGAIVRRENGRMVNGVLTANSIEPGRDMRLPGCDFRQGDLLVGAGSSIDHFDIARLAASGIDRIAVRALPRVALLATGCEIVTPGAPAPSAGNYDSLSFAIGARLAQLGLTVLDLGVVDDHDASIGERARSADADLLIVTGGASGGRHDRARSAFAEDGLDVLVPAVRMKPGKPFWFGRCGNRRLVAGLPGNPVAALAALELFIVPALLAADRQSAAFRWAPCPMSGLKAGEGAERVRFARRTPEHFEIIETNDSAALSPLVGANAMCIVGKLGARRADLLMRAF